MQLVEERFLDIVRRNVKRPYRRAVSLDATLREDLHLNSLGVVMVMTAIERETGLPVFAALPGIGEIITLRDLMQLITRQQAGQAAASP